MLKRACARNEDGESLNRAKIINCASVGRIFSRRRSGERAAQHRLSRRCRKCAGNSRLPTKHQQQQGGTDDWTDRRGRIVKTDKTEQYDRTFAGQKAARQAVLDQKSSGDRQNAKIVAQHVWGDEKRPEAERCGFQRVRDRLRPDCVHRRRQAQRDGQVDSPGKRCAGARPLQQAIDGVERDLDTRPRAQTRIQIDQRRDEGRLSLGPEGDRRSDAERHARRGRACQRPPIPRGQQRQREQHPKLRLIGEQAE